MTNRSWVPSLSISAKAAPTLIRPGNPTPASCGDVLEFAAAKVFPEFVSTHLIGEVDVVKAVAIHVGNRDGAAVIVVAHPHVFGDVVDRVVDECDSAFFEFVGELELMKDLKLLGRFQLGLLARSQGISSHIVFRIAGSDWGIRGRNH